MLLPGSLAAMAPEPEVELSFCSSTASESSLVSKAPARTLLEGLCFHLFTNHSVTTRYAGVHNSPPPIPTLKNPTKTTIGQEQRGFSLHAQAADTRNSVNWVEKLLDKSYCKLIGVCLLWLLPVCLNFVWLRVTVAWFRGD